MTFQNDDFFCPRHKSQEEPGGLVSFGSQRVGHDWSDLAHSMWGIHFLSFFSFPVGLKCRTTIGWSALRFFCSVSCSYQRISFDDPLSRLLPASDGRPLHSSSSRLSSPLQSFLNHCRTIHLLAVPGRWIVVSCLLLYNPFWTTVRKLLKFTFCVTLFP